MEKKILHMLLDSYERRKEGSNRRVQINTEKKLPDLKLPGKYQKTNNAILWMEKENYITVKRNPNTGIPETLYLQEEKAEKIYAYLGRRPRKETDRMLLSFIEKYKNSSPTNHAFCQKLFQIVQENKDSRYRKMESKLPVLLEYISLIENNKEMIYQEEMSALVPGCSTHSFKEEYREDIAGIFREFGNYPTDFDIKDVLKVNHIIQKNYVIKIKGHGTITFINDRIFQIDSLPFLFAFSNNDVDFIKSIETERLLLVENETVFDSVSEDDTLIFFCSGFPGRAEISLLKKINAREYLHSGDLDAGGIYILEDIKKKTKIDFQSYKMDRNTYQTYKEECGIPLTKNDKNRLQELQNTVTDHVLQELIRQMLIDEKKIEQEHIWRAIRMGKIRNRKKD